MAPHLAPKGTKHPFLPPNTMLTTLSPRPSPLTPKPLEQDKGQTPVSSLGPRAAQTSFRALECVWYFSF